MMVYPFPHIKKTLAAVVFTALASYASAEVVDRVVAVINDSIITLSELNAATAFAIDTLGAEERKDSKKIVEVKGKILESLIDQKLIKQAADRAGIDVSEREIDNAIEDIRRQNNNMTQEALLLALAQSGLTYREYREQLKEQIRQVKFVNREFRSKITLLPEDIEDYYRQNIGEFMGPPAFRISVIFLSARDGKVPAGKLKAVTEELGKGADFASVAREYSDGPGASSGGDMGWLKSGETDPIIEEAARKLKPGEVSPAIQSPGGVYFIRLDASRPGEPRPLEEVRAEIQDRLFKKIMDGRLSFWLEEARKTAHIEIRL